jgi:16S rRNA (uracil1498-N3)-methyltransferase
MSKRAVVDPKIIDSVKADKILFLNEDTRHRFLRILRLSTGTPVELLDGTGRVVRGILQTEQPAHLTQVQVGVLVESGPRILLVQAIVKMDKLEQIVQRSTELGVSEILLFDAERSQISFKDKITQKLERLTRIAEDAARQSERSHSPVVSGPYTFVQLLKICAEFPGLKVMGDLSATQTLSELLSQPFCKYGVLVIVGPEGGLTPEESFKLTSHDAQATLWNPNVLRTETAGMAAIAVIQGLTNPRNIGI